MTVVSCSCVSVFMNVKSKYSSNAITEIHEMSHNFIHSMGEISLDSPKSIPVSPSSHIDEDMNNDEATDLDEVNPMDAMDEQDLAIVDDDNNDDVIELDDPDEAVHAYSTLIPKGFMNICPSQYRHLPPTLFMDYPIDTGLHREDNSAIVPLQGAILRYRCKWERYCLRHTFQRNQMKKSDKYWTVAWTKHLNHGELQSLNCLQKVNHFPSSWCIGRKDRLARTMNLMKRLHRDAYNFHPDTYILPVDKENLQRQFQKTSENAKSALYIVKPVASSCGRGIKVKTQEEIQKFMTKSSSKNMLVQKYISNPYLIDGKKFDLRIYVLVTGVDPLRVYVYEEGLTRLSTSDYSTKDIKNKFSHLTNYSINKKSETFVASSLRSPLSTGTEKADADTLTNTSSTSNAGKISLSGTDGYKWSLSAFRAWLAGKESEEVVSRLFEKIHDLCVKTMIAAEGEISSKIHASVNYRTNCFELFGCDVILDQHLEPHLLEVNVSPSLMSSAALDKYIKGILIADTLHIVGVHPYDEKVIHKYDISSDRPANPFEFLSCSKLLTNQDRWRREPKVEHVDFSELCKAAETNKSFWPMLLSIDDELQRAKSTRFLCLHPCPKTVVAYNNLYRHQRFLDHLLGYWLIHRGNRGRLKSQIPAIYWQKDALSTRASTSVSSTSLLLSSSSSTVGTPTSSKTIANSSIRTEDITPVIMSPSASSLTSSSRRSSLRQSLQDAIDIARGHVVTAPAQLAASKEYDQSEGDGNKLLKASSHDSPSSSARPVSSKKLKPQTPHKNKLRISTFLRPTK
jgi:tubulin polyglutamylase TTLL4